MSRLYAPYFTISREVLGWNMACVWRHRAGREAGRGWDSRRGGAGSRCSGGVREGGGSGATLLKVKKKNTFISTERGSLSIYETCRTLKMSRGRCSRWRWRSTRRCVRSRALKRSFCSAPEWPLARCVYLCIYVRVCTEFPFTSCFYRVEKHCVSSCEYSKQSGPKNVQLVIGCQWSCWAGDGSSAPRLTLTSARLLHSRVTAAWHEAYMREPNIS